MALIIAVVLIVVLLAKVGVDKGKTREYDKQSQLREERHMAFVSNFVNERLEAELKSFIQDKHNYEAVWAEVSRAFQEMEHWKDVPGLLLNEDKINYSQPKKKVDGQRAEMAADRRLALDIMLANRGKVSSYSASHGYETYFILEGYLDAKLQRFELVEWIAGALNKQGIHVMPVCVYNSGSSAYGWLGSSVAPDDKLIYAYGKTYPIYRVEPFTKALIEPPSC